MSVLIWLVLGLIVIGLPAAWWWQQKQDRSKRRSKARTSEARDTVADWPPEATRILTAQERRAFDTLREALPGYVLLAQVPLARFIRVPTRYSYGEWLNRVGQLSADLVVCEASTQVIAVVEVRGANETPRSLQRHQRMTRVLKAAGLKVVVWAEGDIPTPTAARAAILTPEALRKLEEAQRAAAAAATAEIRAIPPSTMPKTIPVADVREGPGEPPREPPPTTWYSDLDEPSQPIDDEERPPRR